MSRTASDHTRRGFTLVEVLAALAVLAFGLAAIVGVFMGTLRYSGNSSDRNIAMILIPEAARQIEREHLITKHDASWASSGHIGMFIETLDESDQGDGSGKEARPRSPFPNRSGRCLTGSHAETPPLTVPFVLPARRRPYPVPRRHPPRF